MSDFPSYRELFRIGRDEILANNAKITREVIERQGSDANIIVAMMAAVGDEIIGQLARVCSAGVLAAAKKQALDKLVFDRYGILRNAAAAALGSVEFTTTTPAAGSFSIPQGIRLQTVDGIQFITTASATFPSGSTGPITVAVRSTSAGINQQAAANTITNIVSTITGAPSDLSVTNALATSGAADEETDDALEERARRYFPSLRRGTLEAIEEKAMQFDGVLNAAAFENLDEYGRPAKSVQLVVADQYTDTLAQLAEVPPTYQTQSQQLANNVFLSLSDTRAAGIYVSVTVAKVILQSVVLALSFDAGVDADAVALQARASVVAAINSLDPGENFTSSVVTSALNSVRGLIVTGDELLSPSGTVIPSQLEVLRTTMGLVRASTIQPDTALAGTSNPDSV